MRKWIILIAVSFVAFQAGQALACTSADLENKTNPVVASTVIKSISGETK